MEQPIQRQRQQRAAVEVSRTQILAAAEKLFAAQGIETVSMQDVADEAGVSRATVFNHYGSKSMVLDALCARSLRTYRGMLEAILQDEATGTPALLRRLFAQMGEGLQRNRALYRDLFVELRKASMSLDAESESPGLQRETFALLERIFARGQERGEIKRTHSAAAQATAYGSLLSGAVTRWLHAGEQGKLADLLVDLLDVFLDGAAE